MKLRKIENLKQPLHAGNRINHLKSLANFSLDPSGGVAVVRSAVTYTEYRLIGLLLALRLADDDGEVGVGGAAVPD